MRGLIAKISLVLAVAVLFSQCSRDKTGDRSLIQIKSRGYFIAGINEDFPPMCFRSKDDNELTGFDIDLAQEVAKRLGVKVQFRSVSWDEIITSLNKGDIDTIWTGLTVSDERENLISFSRPYLKNKQVIILLQDSPINNLNMLKDKKAGVQNGSSSDISLNGYVKLVKRLKEVKKYQTNSQALADLSAGKIDAVVIDEITGRWNMAKKPGVFRILNDEIEKTPYSVGVRKNDYTFKETLDKVLDLIKNDTDGENISKKWFGENIFIK